MTGWLDCACGHRLRVPFPNGAKRARCPGCKTIHNAPAEEEILEAELVSPKPDWLECECGQRIRLPLPGGAKRARCPTCQEVLDVPVDSQDDDDSPGTIGLAAEKKCPGCRRLHPAAIALCIECGHDFRSGKRLRQTLPERAESVILDTASPLNSVHFYVRRDSRGRWWLTVKKRFMGIESATAAAEYALADYDSVVTDYEVDDDVEWYRLELQGGRKAVHIWTGTDADGMRALLDLLRDGPGLTIRRR